MSFHLYRWGIWLRAGARILSIACDRPVLFSERYGYQKCWRLGRWSIKLVKDRLLTA